MKHAERSVRSPFSIGRVDANPLLGCDSLLGHESRVGIDWTCGIRTVNTTVNTTVETSARTSRKTSEGDSNTESEVASG